MQAGLGLGVLSIHTMEVKLMPGRLAVPGAAGFPIMRHWYIVHREGKRFTTIVQAFKAFILHEAAGLLQAPTADQAQ